jgi:hypothetical protein
MSRLLVVASLLIPTAAAADGTAAPAGVVAPAPAAKPADLRHRIGVSARAVSLGLDDGTTKTEYGGGGLAVSYRLSRRWELALALDALDAPEGPDLHSTTLEARFHLTPHRRWDWYAIAGVGGLHEAPLEGESHDDAASRGQVNLGAGVARRFPRWSAAVPALEHRRRAARGRGRPARERRDGDGPESRHHPDVDGRRSIGRQADRRRHVLLLISDDGRR